MRRLLTPARWARSGLWLAALGAACGGSAGEATPVVVAPPAIDTRAVAANRQPAHLDPHWARGAFMEIFVRAYQDSDGDGIGDLRGLTSRLDELQALGIRGLWLMPVTRSADGDHGYATTDFRDIEPAYGTLADFDELLAQAHRRGIGVIMDYVINHAAAQHPMFVQARQGPGAPFRDWFVWSDERPTGWSIWNQDPWYHTASQPWLHSGPLAALPAPPAGARGFYFGTFGPHMPDFNFRHPATVTYHLDSLRFWLNRGLDGFRLDAVPHLFETNAVDWNDQPESRALTREIADLIRSYPGRTVVCEATAAPLAWGDPAVCGGAFAFGYVQHFVGAALGQAESVQELASYFSRHPPTMATFVSNHDIFAGRRLWDQVQGDETAYRLAAAGYLLQPGTPFIYYGEEVGQAGVPTLPGDQPLRAPMSWTASGSAGGFTTGRPFRPLAPNIATHNLEAQRRDPGSLWHFYRAMLELRNTRASLARGNFEQAFAKGLLLGFQRRLGTECTWVVINYGPAASTAQLTGLAAAGALRPIYPPAEAPVQADAQGTVEVSVPARSVRVYDRGC